MTSSFSDLLNSSASGNLHSNNTTTNTVIRGFSDRIAGRTGSTVPKFKSIQPPSLPVSPPLFSPSYFAIPPGLSPAELLDSPVLLSSSTILPSPTTGTFPPQTSHWNNNLRKDQQNAKLQDGNYSDFTFQTQTRPSATSSMNSQSFTFENHGGAVERDEAWTFQETTKRDDFSPEIATLQNDSQANYENFQQQTSQTTGKQKSSDDGYNWRKYGQKQVKGSKNPRSYYKCTHPSCPTKKKVERSLDGIITEIVYKGNHNHPKPQATRRSSTNSCQTFQVHHSSQVQDKSHGTTQTESVVTESSSISVTDNDVDQISQPERRISARNDIDEDEPEAKRRKNESESEIIPAPGSKAAREPRVVVQTISDIDILDDGFRWRKYGQKVVKGNPNPRSYYKCTTPGCPVRKHVERASQNLRAVITTYEGKHNHEAPAARGGGSRLTSGSVPENNYNSSDNDKMNVPIRPSVVAAHQNSIATSSERVQISDRLSEPQRQPPFTLERLQNPGSFELSGFGNSNGYLPNPKEEPRHGLFLE